MIRQWEITTGKGTFNFVAESKELAHDHAMTLRDDIDFRYCHGRVLVSENLNERVRSIAVRFVGWVKE